MGTAGGGGGLDYRGLWSRAGRLAADLAAKGVGRGDVVGLAGRRSVDLVVGMLGVARAGAAYLPLDAHAPAERIAAALAEAGAALVVDVDRTAVDGLLGGLPALAPPRDGADFPGVDLDPEDPLYLNHTSGSTGRPKAVVVPHRAVVRLVVGSRYCDVRPGDRLAHLSNPAFDATTFEVWHALASGAEVVVFPSVADLELERWARSLRAERITTMFLTTSLFHMVARERPSAFSEVGTLLVGGEQLDMAMARRVLAAGPPRRLVNVYGPTETTTFASYFDCTPDSLAGRDRVPVGFPLQATTLAVLDDGLRPVPDGVVGELCVGGPGVALGYLGRPEATAERFVAEPGTGARLYRTGDLARRLPDGAFELLGRRDNQVKLRGFRIELEEVERAIAGTGLVDHAYVMKAGEGPAAFLAAFVLPAPGSRDVVGALRGRLGAALPSYMVPARWVVLDALPCGPTGKVDRAGLLASLSDSDGMGEAEKTSDEFPVAPYVPAAAPDGQGGVGGEVERMWRAVLGVPSARPDDNFLDLGGNSILAMQLASRLREALSVELPPAEVLLADSLADLTDRVRRAAALG